MQDCGAHALLLYGMTGALCLHQFLPPFFSIVKQRSTLRHIIVLQAKVFWQHSV